MAFEKKVPEWKAEGSEPPASLKQSGFQAGYKPPAAYFNWFWKGVSEALSELQSGAVQAKQTLATGTDLNTVTVSGFYRLNSGHSNAPAGSDYGQLLVMHGGGDTIAQVLFCYRDSLCWVRGGNPADVSGTGVWYDWKRLSTTDDVPDQLLCEKYTITSTQGGTELDDVLETIVKGMDTVTMRNVSVHDANGKSALGGGTSFLTVCKYNDNHVVVLANKYSEAGALRARVKISGVWHDWEKVYTTSNKPTPAEIGAASEDHSHRTQLWKRSGSGDFAAQTVNVANLSDYSGFEVVYYDSAYSRSKSTGFLPTSGSSFTLESIDLDNSSSGAGYAIFYKRNFEISGSAFVFEDCKLFSTDAQGAGLATQNNCLVPVRIYGIK